MKEAFFCEKEEKRNDPTKRVFTKKGIRGYSLGRNKERGETILKIAKANPFGGKPVIHLSSLYGASLGKEVILRIPVTGARPIELCADGLPEGLVLSEGVVRGVVEREGDYPVVIHASNREGAAEKRVCIKIHPDTRLLTPLMGFTSWNAFGSEVSQEKMERTARVMLESGLCDYGYNYVNVDSGWQKEYGGAFDAVMPNEKFPDMKGFCGRMHQSGLKCGIYSTPMLTAWGCPKEYESIPGCTRGKPQILHSCNNGGIGEERLEENNVRQWNDWGFDYLKYDWAPTEPTNAEFMRRALEKSSREMGYCVTVAADFGYWKYWKDACTSWRDNSDSMDDWKVLKKYLEPRGFTYIQYWKLAVSPGHFYDLDMLEIGAMTWNEGKGTRLTEDEEIFAYTLRAFFLSPIQISCELEKLTEFERDLLCNDEIIALNQDGLVDYPDVFSQNDDLKIYVRRLENGDRAYALFNVSDETQEAVFDFGGAKNVREVWSKTDLPASDHFAWSVSPHGACVLRVSGLPQQSAD